MPYPHYIHTIQLHHYCQFCCFKWILFVSFFFSSLFRSQHLAILLFMAFLTCCYSIRECFVYSMYISIISGTRWHQDTPFYFHLTWMSILQLNKISIHKRERLKIFNKKFPVKIITKCQGQWTMQKKNAHKIASHHRKASSNSSSINWISAIDRAMCSVHCWGCCFF